MNYPNSKEVLSKHPKKATQLQQIKNHLLTRKKITSWDAIVKYKITRISQYIMLLRNEGLNIDTIWRNENGSRFGEYILND